MPEPIGVSAEIGLAIVVAERLCVDSNCLQEQEKPTVNEFEVGLRSRRGVVSKATGNRFFGTKNAVFNPAGAREKEKPKILLTGL